jgi:hypothetical protein
MCYSPFSSQLLLFVVVPFAWMIASVHSIYPLSPPLLFREKGKKKKKQHVRQQKERVPSPPHHFSLPAQYRAPFPNRKPNNNNLCCFALLLFSTLPLSLSEKERLAYSTYCWYSRCRWKEEEEEMGGKQYA